MVKDFTRQIAEIFHWQKGFYAGCPVTIGGRRKFYLPLKELKDIYFWYGICG